MKKLFSIAAPLFLCALLVLPVHAMEYTFSAPDGPEYGKPTSIEVVCTADGGAMRNEDVSKNAALIPPAFGSASAYTLNTGTPLTPNLAPSYMPTAGAIINGSAGITVVPPDLGSITFGSASNGTAAAAIGYTEVTSGLYYANDSLGTLSIPRLGVNVSIFEGTDSSTLAKGAGHFEGTSIWNGNACLAAHNRGVNAYFGQIHTLSVGDTVTLTTKLGTRTYAVTSVEKVPETDASGLVPTAENCVTLFTCVRDQRAYRWCVRGVEIM